MYLNIKSFILCVCLIQGSECAFCGSVCVSETWLQGVHTQLPFVLQSLDIEAERWGDGADVLAIKLLHDGGLPCVVQTST